MNSSSPGLKISLYHQIAGYRRMYVNIQKKLARQAENQKTARPIPCGVQLSTMIGNPFFAVAIQATSENQSDYFVNLSDAAPKNETTEARPLLF